MFELGDTAESEHQGVTDYLQKNKIGQTFLVGNHFYKTKTKASHISKFKTFEELKKILEQKPDIKNSFLLIKASRGMALERILDLL